MDTVVLSKTEVLSYFYDLVTSDDIKNMDDNERASFAPTLNGALTFAEIFGLITEEEKEDILSTELPTKRKTISYDSKKTASYIQNCIAMDSKCKEYKLHKNKAFVGAVMAAYLDNLDFVDDVSYTEEDAAKEAVSSEFEFWYLHNLDEDLTY